MCFDKKKTSQIALNDLDERPVDSRDQDESNGVHIPSDHEKQIVLKKFHFLMSVAEYGTQAYFKWERLW